MTIINIAEYNTKCYGVTFEKNGCLEVQKFKDISDHKNVTFCIKPLERFLGKSQLCEMTMFSGAFDKSIFDGNTILLKVS